MSDILRAAQAIAGGFSALDGAEAAFVVNEERRIVSWPTAAERLTGFSAVEATGREPSALLAMDARVRGEITQLLERVLVVGATGLTRPLTRKGRGSFWANVRVTALKDKNEKPLGYLVLVRDLRAGQDFVPQLERLRALEEALQDAAGVAHDLNNLLTVLLSEVSAASGREVPVHRPGRGADEVAGRMAALLQRFVRVIKGQRRTPGQLNANETVTRVVRILAHGGADGAETILNLDPALALIRGDALEIEEVVLNLVINARHATPDGGYVLLETANVHVARPIASTGQTLGVGDYVRVAVQDSGSGMSDEALAHLFEAFYSTKGPGCGTGLGLSSALRIVNRSGGVLLVKSRVGWGTLAEVYLPIPGAPCRQSEELSR